MKVGLKRTRHAVPAALIGDVVAALAAVAICAWLFLTLAVDRGELAN